ncbi:MAG: BsaA family SipW-dependent biofilm matrix protein, partial [Clostridium sp.]|nr:BsaA family SipW-dependent biofilm matrix protein [Clostridium sp.]
MKNSKLFAAAGLGALVVVGGTFAYYNTTQTFNNPFNTTDYGTYVTEHFNVDDGSEWKPGATVAKEI